jgi:hypothetical protein
MHSNEARRSIRTKANNLGRCRASIWLAYFTVAGAAVDSLITSVRLTTLPVYPIQIDLVSTDRHLE